MSAVAKPPVDWELVYERNSVERIKRDKPPLGIREELPALVAQGYEAMAEEDVVRLQWWGLYHDKPKIGTFMLRVKVPAGQLSPSSLRAIGEVSNRYGRGDGELSTRQNIQLHWLELARLPEVFADLERSGVTTAGGCGDTVRNITGCPVQGIAADELFDASPTVTAAADLFYGNPDWANLPRKHKYSISACPDRCNAPEINCISLIGVVHEGREGFAVLVGGGLSSVPRIARELGAFIPKEQANEILGAITSVWSEDLRYRVSRVKARLKFMVDDIGPEGMRERVEARLGRRLSDYALAPVTVQPSPHLGVHAQKQEGLSFIGVPVNLGLVSGDQMIGIAELAERYGGDIRLTRQQNFIVTGVPNERVAEARRERRSRRSAFRSTSTRCAATRSPARASPTATSRSPTRSRAWARSSTGWTSASDRSSPSCACTSTAARTPAPSTGSETSASRARRRATRGASGARPTTSSCAAGSAPIPRSAARSSGACRPTSSTPPWRG